MRLGSLIAVSVLGAAVSFSGSRPGITQVARPAAGVTVADPLDINTASPQQLNALPGFGAAYTRRVIAGRPYTAKNQLVTRGVLPQNAYDRVAALIVAHRVAPTSAR